MITENQVVQKIAEEIGKSSLRQVAKAKGISAPYLSDVVNGRRNISGRVAGLFGYEQKVTERVVTYKEVTQ